MSITINKQNKQWQSTIKAIKLNYVYSQSDQFEINLNIQNTIATCSKKSLIKEEEEKQGDILAKIHQNLTNKEMIF